MLGTGVLRQGRPDYSVLGWCVSVHTYTHRWTWGQTICTTKSTTPVWRVRVYARVCASVCVLSVAASARRLLEVLGFICYTSSLWILKEEEEGTLISLTSSIHYSKIRFSWLHLTSLHLYLSLGSFSRNAPIHRVRSTFDEKQANNIFDVLIPRLGGLGLFEDLRAAHSPLYMYWGYCHSFLWHHDHKICH